MTYPWLSTHPRLATGHGLRPLRLSGSCLVGSHCLVHRHVRNVYAHMVQQGISFCVTCTEVMHCRQLVGRTFLCYPCAAKSCLHSELVVCTMRNRGGGGGGGRRGLLVGVRVRRELQQVFVLLASSPRAPLADAGGAEVKRLHIPECTPPQWQ